MIPSEDMILSDEDIEIETEPSKNYKMDSDKKVIVGHSDDLEAMSQVIYKILNTERYDHVIYSCDYGIELDDLYGEPVSYVCPELEDRIIEALDQDDRIEQIEDFEFDTSEKGKIVVTFTVYTIFGEIPVERTVDI